MASSHGHSDATCPLCDAVATAPAAEIVADHGPWMALTMLDVPGWIRVTTKRHVEGPWSLSDEEAATLGPMLQAVAQAVHEATGAERVYTVGLGEGAIHFHYALLPRLPGETPLFTGAPLVGRAADAADVGKSSAVAARIRASVAARELG